MVNRLRTGWLAGSAVLVLVLAVSGTAMAARVTSDTSVAFADVDGDGVDDACQEAASENTEAATAAFEAADLNDDGEISVSEAAQSGWTGGTNCNHGGYVNQVAQADDEACDAPETGDAGETGDAARPAPRARPATRARQATRATGDAGEADAACATDEATEGRHDSRRGACEEVAAPEPETPLDPTAPTATGLGGMVAGSEAPAARTATTVVQ
jgi:hypothetical protein